MGEGGLYALKFPRVNKISGETNVSSFFNNSARFILKSCLILQNQVLARSCNKQQDVKDICLLGDASV